MEVRVEQAASIVVIRGTYLFIYLKIQVSRFVSYWSCKNPGSVLKQSKLKNEFSPPIWSLASISGQKQDTMLRMRMRATSFTTV